MVCAVVFDVWGTLLKTRVFLERIARELCSLLGNDDVDSLLGKLLEVHELCKIARRRGAFREDWIVEDAINFVVERLGISAELLRRAIARAVLSVSCEELIIDGVPEVLEEVSSLGLKVGLLSNVLYWPGSYTRLVLERCGLGRYFEVQLYADEIRCLKPKREAFTKVAQVLGVEVEDMIYVGDSVVEDAVGALLSGARAILLSRDVRDVVNIGNLMYIAPHVKFVPSIVRTIVSK